MNKSGLTVNKTLKYLPERPPVDIEFQDLSFSVPVGRKTSKLILKSISGNFRSGQVTAILGPSGSGKSSLLNILAGYKTDDTTGNIFINGERRDVDKFSRISRYIMQDDHIQPYLTVLESMTVAADLKLGSYETKENKGNMINEILDLLNLSRSKATRAKNLSGGERKRLSVALELLNNPPVIFLDEPTTGLDDVACSQCIGLLKLLALGGRTVICSLHTPSAKLFSVFDNVYILSQGQCAYQGCGSEVVPYLEKIGLVCPISYNPADFILEVCNQEYGDFQKKLVASSENGLNMNYVKEYAVKNQMNDESMNKIKKYEDPHHKKHIEDRGSTFWQQISILTMRIWIQTWRDKSGLLLRTFIHLFLGILIGNVYIGMGNDGSKSLYLFGFFYVCIIFCMFVPMVPFLLWVPMEMRILKREYFNRWYGLGSYYLAVTIANVPIQMVLLGIYVALTYTLTSQPMDIYRIVLFYIICFLTAMVAESYGIIMGVIFNIVNALFLGTTSKVPMMLLATYGFGSGYDAIPGWIRFSMYFDYLRYSMEGLMATMLRNREIIPCPEEEDWCLYTDVSYFLRSMGMENSIIWVDIVALVIFLIVFRIVGFYLLKQRLRPNKYLKAVYVVAKLVKSHFGP
ncbi:ATP-binding cassette sub-family G member 1-like [Coccinella septempunctata]|uniref:ATP-binding cassette sub-family G member 1-like n=1 Tax=Coccinella septempunctata TaxID=41139 RepID=UPI001D08E75F|nr:ATP-binding cassette sub-family G member 1-like [Coccinella septempunctata]